jgi:hypothetical protein
MAVSAAACGDNSLPDGEPLGSASHVAIASTYEPGLFAPDLDDIVARHLGATIVFVN